MLKKVEQYIEKWKMLQSGDVVVTGVSGGADSVCLLLILDALREEKDFEIIAVHVNHGIRGEEADADERFVKELCEKRGIICKCVAVDVPEVARQRKLSEEEAGRIVRREIFEQMAKAYGGTKIALAHHQDDNAETFFLHLARGSGLKGLGGIYPVNGMYIRPLLCVERTEIEAYLETEKMTFCTDATNQEDAYMRNRIRNHVLPYFKNEINSRTVEHMNKSMEQLREVWNYMEQQVKLAWEVCVKEKDLRISICKMEYEEQESLIQKMLLRKALVRVAGHEKDLEQIHVETLEQLFQKQVGRSVDLPYRMRAIRTYEGIELEIKKETKKEEEETTLDLGKNMGEAFWKECRISWRIFEKDSAVCEIPKKTYTKWFDYDIIKQSVAVRTRRAGDSIAIDKEGKHQKLKSYFINEKIPSEERSAIMLITEGSEVLWIVGHRQSKAYQVTEQTTKILEITINGGTLDGRESKDVNSRRRSECQN